MSLRESLDEIPIIDTHEHFLPLRFLMNGKDTLLQILRNSYLGIDCIAAGMDKTWWKPGSVVHSKISLERDGNLDGLPWDILIPFLNRIRYTSYYRSLMAGFEKLYGIDPGLQVESWVELAKRVWEMVQRNDWFESGLNAEHIQFVLRDAYFSVAAPDDWNPRVCSILRMDDFVDHPWIHPVDGEPAVEVAKQWGVVIKHLEDLLTAIDTGFTRFQERKSVAVKLALAYRRPLNFNHVSLERAQAAFQNLKKGPDEESRITLGNYVIWHIIDRSIEYGFPIQFHTGMNYGQLKHSDPTNLVNLIQECTEARFVLLHGGYPYSDEAGLMAKTFPNVYLDLCWMPQLSVTMAAEVLSRWLELVPYTKFMWGGDVWTIEECVGSAIFFKDVLAKVLTAKIEEGTIEKREAMDIAEKIMCRNATALFDLEGRYNR